MTASRYENQSDESATEDQRGDDTQRAKNAQPEGPALKHQHIVNAFILFGRDKQEAEQWIKTSLHTTCLYLEQSLITEPKRWTDRYPTTPHKEIREALKSEIGAALWYLTGGVEEKHKNSSWTPTPGIEYSIRTRELVKHLAAHPENSDDIAAESQIERLQKELQRISKKIRKGKATLPYHLRNAPDWKLIALGPKGPGKGHRFLRATSHTVPISRCWK